MQLIGDEKQALDGGLGDPMAKAIRILIRLGETYGAERLVSISSAHLVGCSYQIAGDAGLEVYERLVEDGARVRVPTTLDPGSTDFKHWRELKVPSDYAAKQDRIAELLERMGAIPTWTCTPYNMINVPLFGQHLGWSESSAVAFANSVVGARTNRLGAYADLCAALVGRVPCMGLHLTENRRGRVLIKLSQELAGAFSGFDLALLGLVVGELAGERVPVVIGIREASLDQLKMFSAAAASSGGVAMYHIVGITPEARTLEEALQGCAAETVITLDRQMMDQMLRKMTTYGGGQVDLVGLGCPHASITQIADYVRLLRGRHVHPEVQLWICTNELTAYMSARMGYDRALAQAGARIVVGTCLNDCPLSAWSFRAVLTDSGKFCYYLPTTMGVRCGFAGTEECIEAAVCGTWYPRA